MIITIRYFIIIFQEESKTSLANCRHCHTDSETLQPIRQTYGRDNRALVYHRHNFGTFQTSRNPFFPQPSTRGSALELQSNPQLTTGELAVNMNIMLRVPCPYSP